VAQQGSSMIFVGIHGTVLALEASRGAEVWRTRLGGSHFVNVVVDGDAVYAGTQGKLFCLSAASGTIRWENQLKGLGMGLVTIGVAGQSTLPAAKAQMEADAATSAAATAAVVTAIS
jgi:outer membrane protein assembly factor BamB